MNELKPFFEGDKIVDNNQDLLAPPTEEELKATEHLAAPTEEELKATENLSAPSEETITQPQQADSSVRSDMPMIEMFAQDTPSPLERFGGKVEALTQLPGYLAEEVPQEVSKAIQDPGLAADVAARNIAQGASPVGSLPKTSAAYEKYALAPAYDKFRTLLSPLLGHTATDQDVKDFFTKWVPERYENRSIEELAAANKAHEEAQNAQLPVLAGVGQGAGMIPGIVTGGQVVKAAGIGSKLLQGGIATAGNVFPRSFIPAYEKSGDLSEAAIEATEDAVLAGTLDIATRGAIEKVTPEAASIKNARNIMARRALGGTPSEQPRLQKMQTQIGEQIFPEKGPSLMGPLTTKAQLAENLKTAANTAGKELESARGIISDAGENAVKNIESPVASKAASADVPVLENGASESVIPKQIVDPVQEQAIVQKIASQAPEVQAKVQELLNPRILEKELTKEFLTQLEKKWPGSSERLYQDLLNKNQIIPVNDIKQPTLENFFKNRMYVDNHINFEKQLLPNGRMASTVNGDALKIYRDIFNKKLMSRAQQIDQLAGTKAFDTFKDASDRYHILETISKTASKAVNKEQSILAKAVIPATVGTAVTGAGAALGGGPLALAAAGTAAVGYGVKTLGNQFAANSLNLLHKLVTKSPQLLGQYAAPLQEAAGRGSGALAALNYALYSKDSEYRATIDQLQEEVEKADKNQ